MSATFDALVDKWGVLLTYEALSSVMKRSPRGLSRSLAQNRSDWTKQINAAKVRIGGRVLFRTDVIAAIIDGESPSRHATRRGTHSELAT